MFTGKVTGQRVLPSVDEPRVETTNELRGELGGVETTWLATYSSKFRPDGSVYGDCRDQGVFMTADGVGTWTGAGVGRITAAGAVSFRGAVYLTSAPPKLEELTKSALVFEYVDGEEATLPRWEWK
jgi:hypothetical protein